jgi:hypothetical protein
MRRITREKDISMAVRRDLPVVEMKTGEPGRIAKANRSDCRWVNDCLQLGQRQITGRHLTLGRISSCGRRHGDDAPCRGPAQRKEHGDAPAAGERVDSIWFEGTVCLDVAQYEVLGIAAAFEGNARPLPHGAVRTVATDQKPRTDPFLSTIISPKHAFDTVRDG